MAPALSLESSAQLSRVVDVAALVGMEHRANRDEVAVVLVAGEHAGTVREVGQKDGSSDDRGRSGDAGRSVSADEVHEADTRGLRAIADLVDQRDHVEEKITPAVRAARQANWSWSEIGAMLGVSKQALHASTATRSPPEPPSDNRVR